MARGIPTWAAWSATTFVCAAAWLAANTAVAISALKPGIRANGFGPYTLVSIAKIQAASFPQPPAPYLPRSSWTRHQFSEAVAYFIRPTNEALPEEGTVYNSSLRAYVVPDRGLPVPVPITEVRDKLMAVQFPTEWPASVHDLHLMVTGKRGESRYLLTGWRDTKKERDRSSSSRREAPPEWVRAWRADRTGFVDQQPSLTISLSPQLDQNGTFYRIKNLGFTTETGYDASGGRISNGVVNAPMTVASAWYDADMRQTMRASFVLERFQAVDRETVKASLIHETTNAWIYQIDSRTLGQIRWTVNKQPEYGFHQGELETQKPVTGVDHSELEIAELGASKTWIDPNSIGHMPVRTGQRMLRMARGSLTIYRRVSQTDYFASVKVTESRKPEYGMPFENWLSECSTAYEP